MTRNQYAKLYAQQFAIYERRLYPIFLRALNRQVQPVIDWIKAHGTTIEIPLDILIDRTVFRVPFMLAYQTIGVLAARREYAFQKEQDGLKATVLEILVNTWSQFFREYANEYSYRIENKLSETTKDQVRGALAEGFANDLNADDIISLLQRRVNGVINKVRAKMIVRTEITTIANLAKEKGARDYFQQQNIEGYKQWIGRGDKRERPAHLKLNDTIIPINDKWELEDEHGTHLCDRPGDPNLPKQQRIKCRCTQMFMSARRAQRLLAMNN